MSRQTISTTRADGTRSTYTLQPGSTVPMQLEALKPLKPSRIKADRRTYPKYKPGMSTADYVAMYEAANNGNMHRAGFWQPLNTAPAAGYCGIDTVEHGDFDLIADDGADLAPAAPVVADAAPVPDAPAAVAPVADAAPAVAAPAAPSPLQSWQSAAARAGVDPVATDTEADSMGDACADRFGTSDPLACVHVAAFADWHRATLAEIRGTAAPVAAAPAAAAPVAPIAPAAADPAEVARVVQVCRDRAQAWHDRAGDAIAPALAQQAAELRTRAAELATDARMENARGTRFAAQVAADLLQRVAIYQAAAAVLEAAPAGPGPDSAPAAPDPRAGSIASARRIGAEDWQRGDAMRNEAAARRGLRWSDAEWRAYCEGFEAAEAAASVDPGPGGAPVRRDAAADRAAQLAGAVVAAVGTDPARVAAALRREAARVAAAAAGMPPGIADSYRRTAAALGAMADAELARAAPAIDAAAAHRRPGYAGAPRRALAGAGRRPVPAAAAGRLPALHPPAPVTADRCAPPAPYGDDRRARG